MGLVLFYVVLITDIIIQNVHFLSSFRHNTFLSEANLSYCHIAHHGNVQMHWYILAHSFCRCIFAYCILQNSCSESSDEASLEQVLCLSSLEFSSFYPPSPLSCIHFMTTLHLLHDLIICPQGVKSTCIWWQSFRCGKRLRPCNFLAKHIVSYRC